MKPQFQPQSIPVLRHVHDFCVAWGLSQVIALTAEAVPSVLLTQEPHPISNPNHSLALQHLLAILLISTRRQSNPIASSFLQVAVSKAPTHSNVIHDSSQGA